MRNIEFKGLTKNEPNTWVYGYLLPDNNIYQTRDEEKGGKGMFSIIPESVGQYTGRRDKHNVKIYENDIVKDFERGHCFKVKCENGAFLLDDEDMGFIYILYSYPTDRLEVVGNSFELKKSEINFEGISDEEFFMGLLGLL